MVVLGLGSNLGDREGNISKMLEALKTTLTEPIICSELYKTDPVGVDNHNFYLNIVVAGEYTKTPIQLLRETQAIEKSLGRRGKGELAPRTADIDILLFNDLSINSEELAIPHHALFDRHFEIKGAKRVVPNMKIPGTNIYFKDYTIPQRVKEQRVEIIREVRI